MTAGPTLQQIARLKGAITVGVSAILTLTAPKAVSVRVVGRLSTILLSAIPHSSQTRAEPTMRSQFQKPPLKLPCFLTGETVTVRA